MSYREVSIIMKPPPHNWIKPLIKKHGPISIKILDCKPVGKEKVIEFVKIKCNSNEINDMIESIRKSKYVDKIEIVNIDKKNGTAAIVLETSHCTVCKLFFTVPGCFLGSAVYEIKDGCVRWYLISEMEVIRKILKRIRERGVEVYIDKITPVDLEERSPKLTKRQREILDLAFRFGLFDHPRKITLRNFSKILNLSPVTVSEILRSGLKKLLKSYLEESETKRI